VSGGRGAVAGDQRGRTIGERKKKIEEVETNTLWERLSFCSEGTRGKMKKGGLGGSHLNRRSRSSFNSFDSGERNSPNPFLPRQRRGKTQAGIAEHRAAGKTSPSWRKRLDLFPGSVLYRPTAITSTTVEEGGGRFIDERRNYSSRRNLGAGPSGSTRKRKFGLRPPSRRNLEDFRSGCCFGPADSRCGV